MRKRLSFSLNSHSATFLGLWVLARSSKNISSWPQLGPAITKQIAQQPFTQSHRRTDTQAPRDGHVSPPLEAASPSTNNSCWSLRNSCCAPLVCLEKVRRLKEVV